VIDMVHKLKGKRMVIDFRNPDVDTEEVRKAIEDKLGVEILGITEEIKPIKELQEGSE